MSHKAAKQMIVSFLQGDSDMFDIIGEGDDGEHFFASHFILMLGFRKSGNFLDKLSFRSTLS